MNATITALMYKNQDIMRLTSDEIVLHAGRSTANEIEADNKADRQIAADGQPIDCGHKAFHLQRKGARSLSHGNDHVVRDPTEYCVSPGDFL